MKEDGNDFMDYSSEGRTEDRIEMLEKRVCEQQDDIAMLWREIDSIKRSSDAAERSMLICIVCLTLVILLLTVRVFVLA